MSPGEKRVESVVMEKKKKEEEADYVRPSRKGLPAGEKAARGRGATGLSGESGEGDRKKRDRQCETAGPETTNAMS
jgi:hypothetical protein